MEKKTKLITFKLDTEQVQKAIDLMVEEINTHSHPSRAMIREAIRLFVEGSSIKELKE